MEAYTNAIQPCFRRLLQWAEAASEAIDDAALALIPWAMSAKPTGSCTYDILSTIAEGRYIWGLFSTFRMGMAKAHL